MLVRMISPWEGFLGEGKSREVNIFRLCYSWNLETLNIGSAVLCV